MIIDEKLAKKTIKSIKETLNVIKESEHYSEQKEILLQIKQNFTDFLEKKEKLNVKLIEDFFVPLKEKKESKVKSKFKTYPFFEIIFENSFLVSVFSGIVANQVNDYIRNAIDPKTEVITKEDLKNSKNKKTKFYSFLKKKDLKDLSTIIDAIAAAKRDNKIYSSLNNIEKNKDNKGLTLVSIKIKEE